MPAALRALFPPRPTVPAPLAWPLALIPGPVHSAVLTQALNLQFATPIQNDEFAFLRDRVLAIEVRDARIQFRFFEGSCGVPQAKRRM